MTDNNKGRPFLIEYLSAEGQLLNKFKFVLAVTTVADLKDKICEKLIGKVQLEIGQKIAIKDIDDFELGSDDETTDVVPDGKVRVYLVKDIKVQQVMPVQAPVQVPAQTVAVIPQLASLAAVDIPILDLKNFTSPTISGNYPKDKILKVVCPQIRKSPF